MAVKQGQNTVNPIRDLEQIQIIKEYLLHQSYRDYFLFTFGINSGLRINDILKLRVIDVQNTDYLQVKEKKTNQTRKVRMTSVLKQEIEKYTRQMADSDLLFPSRKGTGPIGRETAWRIINNAAQVCGIEGATGTHSMRKTFGYHFYQQTKDVATLQQIFGHSAPSVTLRYIGVTPETADQLLEQFCL
ncbi:site-specific integrase [Domibacillus sp. DTU_2020_1001157_1_SI_ALB_TIR_016]|uniref:site-specific integrase n=1 Tax=Domibacillus sp. DTU_2020_1001157_1_SI_ALB_TIR_016 TaxID=3077789 RepID=UPI0028ED7109|nr:site-specific integrase [Domibacillus sp. DTU_2020_1001157_1_SI_ALB_TIR_016]WNS77786.1 site-specific integrase [Domibacillus sp. DTU_2020_1001157_1_SI_ALB_TIR_016]